MSKLVELAEHLKKIEKEVDQKTLDAKASYVILENCINFLNMNDMSELQEVKVEIKKTMKKLKDVAKDGEKTKDKYRANNRRGHC